MSYFDDAFNKAFPPRKSFPPYQYPDVSRKTSPMTDLTLSDGTETPGKRVAIPVRTVTEQGLETSYGYEKLPTSALVPARVLRVAPADSLMPHGAVQYEGQLKRDMRPFDPLGAFNFVLTIGKQRIGFQKFDGLNVEIDQIEYKDSLDAHPHKRPGMYHFGNIKLTKGQLASQTGGTATYLWDWINQIMKGNIDRRNGTLEVMDDSRNEARLTYHFYQAWPCKWTGLNMNATGSDALIEELELVVDYVELVKG